LSKNVSFIQADTKAKKMDLKRGTFMELILAVQKLKRLEMKLALKWISYHESKDYLNNALLYSTVP